MQILLLELGTRAFSCPQGSVDPRQNRTDIKHCFPTLRRGRWVPKDSHNGFQFLFSSPAQRWRKPPSEALKVYIQENYTYTDSFASPRDSAKVGFTLPMHLSRKPYGFLVSAMVCWICRVRKHEEKYKSRNKFQSIWKQTGWIYPPNPQHAAIQYTVRSADHCTDGELLCTPETQCFSLGTPFQEGYLFASPPSHRAGTGDLEGPLVSPAMPLPSSEM